MLVKIYSLTEFMVYWLKINELSFSLDFEECITAGIEVPNFKLINHEGIKVDLHNYISAKKILVLSSSECPYCLEFYPALKWVY